MWHAETQLAYNGGQLIRCLEGYNWTHVLRETDVDLAYQAFLDVLHWHINNTIPIKKVSMPTKTPSYITPLVKSLLRKKNKCMHKGNLDKAASLATKISRLISEFRSKCLSKVDPSSSKQLRGRSAKNNGIQLSDQPVDIDALNSYFASVTTDHNYDIEVIRSFLDNNHDMVHNGSRTQLSASHQPSVMEFEVQRMLERIKKSSPGTDDLPYWVFQQCSYQLAPVITHIFNLSLSSGKPPMHWKKAVVTPVPKVSNPTAFTDLRPISVTPLLSRTLERFIVKNCLLPAIPSTELADQFAFHPTGSTTAAIVHTLHHVTSMLEDNSYVRCILVDFSKAFDTINHQILFSKLQKLSLQPAIFSWLVNFLTGRTQAVCLNGNVSDFLDINQSIIQGSGIGPVLYILFASDLHTLSNKNVLTKYADDTTLISPRPLTSTLPQSSTT